MFFQIKLLLNWENEKEMKEEDIGGGGKQSSKRI